MSLQIKMSARGIFQQCSIACLLALQIRKHERCKAELVKSAFFGGAGNSSLGGTDEIEKKTQWNLTGTNKLLSLDPAPNLIKFRSHS